LSLGWGQQKRLAIRQKGLKTKTEKGKQFLNTIKQKGKTVHDLGWEGTTQKTKENNKND